jgi:serine protease
MAWEARVMPVRALGLWGGTDYDVAQAIRFASGLDNDSGTVPPAAARVINMSIGGPEVSDWFQRTLNDAARAGVVVVAAAGNESSSAPSYPAAYQHVVSVASTTSSNGKSSFSNYGPMIDVAAPGSNILSTWGSGSGYSYSSGTSMACPHAAGWVALMLSANPALTVADVEAIIAGEDVFTDLGAPGRDDTFGHGLIHAAKAVAVAAGFPAGMPVIIPELELSPDQVIVGPLLAAEHVTGANIGEGSFTAESATPSGAWVSVDGFAASGSDFAFDVAIDRAGFAPGIHQTDVTVSLSTGQEPLPVVAIARADDGAGDLGRQYAVLVDGDGATVASAAVVDGAFSFAAVPPGTYRLVVGTDADNDGRICGHAEGCGAHPSLAAPADLVVAADDTAGLAVVTDWLFYSRRAASR